MDGNVILTEQEELIELLKRNISRNKNNIKNGSIVIDELNWNKENALKFQKKYGNFEYIIACDVIYEPLYGEV